MIEALHNYYTKTKVPTMALNHQREAGEQMTRARQRMATWLNVSEDEVHFGPSASQNSYVVAQALKNYFKPGDEIIVTNQIMKPT